MRNVTRRSLIAATGAAALARPMLIAAKPALPTSPLSLNVVDATGGLQLLQAAFEDYRAAHPSVVSHFSYSTAPPPQLPSKLKAQQDAHNLDIDVVLASTDAVMPGIELGVWLPLQPDYTEALPDLQKILQPGAWALQQLINGQGICAAYTAVGPLLEFMPDNVPKGPESPQELLDWARAHPGRLLYARPANSGPARGMIQALPYVLGDSNPKDPAKGWDKTWGFLTELGKYVEYYAAGTVPTMQELAQGSRDMIFSSPGWDINPRALGMVPQEAEVSAFKNFKWISEAVYILVPKGIAQDKLAVALDLINFVLTLKQQAYTYDNGYFYPGPAVKDVPLSMAPIKSQQALKPLVRAPIAALIASVPYETPLPAKDLVYMFQRWDQQVGSHVSK